MTAETEVRSELSEVSKVAIEEQCGLDMSSYEDLPKVGGDCNGVNKHVDDDKEEDAEDTKVNVNGKDDPDGSYVFVSRSDSGNGAPIDRDLKAECVQKSHIVPESQVGQLGELNDENEETLSGEHNCIAEGTDVAPDSSLVKPKVEGDGVLVQYQNATAVVESECKGLDGEAKIEEQICPDSASDLEENREFPTMDSEVGHCGTPQCDDGKIESEEQINLESTAELGEVEESQIVVLEVGDLHDGVEKPEEQNNLESNAHFGENKEVKIGKIESEEQTNLESTAELGEVQESQIVVFEVGDLHDEEEKPEEQNNIESNAHFRESKEVKTVLSEAAECKSSLLDGKVNSKEHADIESTTELQGSQEPQVMGPEALVNEGNEASELADETDLPLETEIANEHVSEENKDSCLAHVEDSIPQAKVLNELVDGCQNPTEFKGSSENAESLPSPADCMRPEIEFGSELVESIISCPTECKLPEVEVRKVIAEKQTKSESPQEVKESEESQIGKPESAESESCQLDNGEGKLEEEEKTDLRMDIKENHESQLGYTDNVVEGNEASKFFNETDVPLETEITNEHVSEENKDSCPAHVEDSIPQAKVLNELINGSQNLTEFKGSSENAESLPSPADCMRPEIEVGSEPVESICSCRTECKLPEVEVRKVIAEKQTKLKSPQKDKESEESQIRKPEFAEPESYQLDNGEGKLEEEVKTDLRMDIQENHESQLVFTDNAEGNEASKLADETDVLLETEIANEHVSEENNKDSCPTHVEDSISQAKVLNELIDGRQNSTELNGSSENAESLPSPADCMRPEIEVGSEPVESIRSCPTECKLPEVEVRKAIAEKHTKSESPQKVKESEESQIRKPESAEPESYQLDNGEGKLEEEVKTDLRMDIQENHESQLVFTDNTEGNEVSKLANETDVLLETEIANEHVSEENNKDSCPTHVEDSISQAKVLNELIDGRQNSTELNGSSENAESLPSPADCIRPEIEVGSEPVECVRSCPSNDAKLKIEIKNDTVGGDIITSCNEVSSETDIGLRSIDPEGKVSTLSCADVNSESEVSNRITDCACSLPIAVNGLDAERHAYDSLLNVSGADMKSESPIENSSSISGRDLPCNDDAVSQSGGLDGSVVNCGTAPHCVTEALDVQEDGYQVNGGDGDDYHNLMCQKTKDTGRVHRDEISTSSPERLSADALAEQSAGVEAVKRPFHFLIKIPKYEDEKLREQIRDAKLQVDKTTQQRDAIRVDIQMIRANGQQLHNNYEAVKSEERTARGLVRLKRQEIDSVQSVINKVKNAISVKDIDRRIQSMEHMIQHETLPLKEEKQFIREIKQLKHLREQLSSNMGSQDEVQQALDQRDIIEERLKILKKELDCLKDKVSKAEATTAAAEKKCNDESKKLTELHNQFRAANGIRQEAYMHFQNLWIQQKEKNTGFWMYKDDATTANGYALSRDKEALHCLCVNQVETIMELWNKNDEFRKEYLRCNTRSTVRRLSTLDGLALGPDEEPTVLPNVVDERSDRSRSTPGKPNSELPILTLEQEKQVSTVEGEETGGKSTAKVAEQMDQTARTKKPGKLTLTNESATVSSSDETKEMSEEKHKQTKEQLELARKEEELRKEVAAAKLKEQRQLEEKVKAKEALERKRRNAEKALIRAELRAQKEAEQKEKEREKRAKKKERKKAVAGEAPDGNNGGETIPTSESLVVITKEREIKESPSTITKRPQKPIQFTKQSKTKSIPPPLRNRGKRRLQQWIWVILTAVIVLALFLLGNIGFYSSLGHNLRMQS